ncbi:MAG: hypothetical protein JNM84_22655 [Planctomycetes bacterium]|nr:hypothetical protein [Planctomycetota bacterium]
MSAEPRGRAEDAAEFVDRAWRESTVPDAEPPARAPRSPRSKFASFLREHWPYLLLPALFVILLFAAALFYVRVIHRSPDSSTPFQYRTQ